MISYLFYNAGILIPPPALPVPGMLPPFLQYELSCKLALAVLKQE